ncbi:MAG: pepA 2 [Gammaproteobacteria bacterium]|jgi:leucyl aminopeptidase|nr:pepA 2 [Gammaproteobacteria bacterium]
MLVSSLTDQADHSVVLLPIDKAHLDDYLKSQDDFTRQWLSSVNFDAEVGKMCSIPDHSGHIKQVLVAVNPKNSLWSLAECPKQLPVGTYELQDSFHLLDPEKAALGWGLACYRFDRYASNKKGTSAQLKLSKEIIEKVQPVLEACFLVRDLINTPAEDMGPEQLSAEAHKLAEAYQAEFNEVAGKDLLKQGFAGIYTVGKGAAQSPRLIDIKWGKASNPKLTLVGKGVCFDSGGLNIKPGDNMLLMKKDMGGAAHVLGLAKLIMQANLPVCLRVLIPAVENAVSKDSYRPGDIITSKNGKTIEVGNTDAEGRVVLADALSEASQEQPDLLIDFATLTGAARVALGTALPALFSNQDELAWAVVKAGKQENDPLWQMPLFAPYKRFIKGKIADLSNNPSTGMGGAITAALFLECFVNESIPWMHIDLMAWNDSNQPGRPEGGEAMGMRAMFAYLAKRYAS